MKCLLKIIVALILGLALLIGGGIALINPMVSTLITEGVGYTTQQETSLDSLNLGLLSGEFSFEGLAIANPPGFQETPLLTIHSFRTQLDTSAVGGERIDINLVELDGLELALELKGTESNVNALLARLKELQAKLSAGDETPDAEETPEPTDDSPGEGPTIRIQRIRVAGVKASLRISDVPLADGVYEVSVPDFVLEDFGSEMDDATSVEWTAYLLESVLNQALSAGDGAFPSQWQGFLQSELAQSGLLEGDFQGAMDKGTEALKTKGDELLKEAQEDPEGALESLKKDGKKLEDLFGGGK